MILAGLIAASALTACQSAGPVEPAAIVESDTCARCKQPIQEPRFAAQFVTRDGFVRKFDDIGCMIDHAKRIPKNITASWLMDYDRKEWLRPEEGFFVRSERFKTPNNGGILAFGDRDRAKELAEQYGGELLDFDALMQ